MPILIPAKETVAGIFAPLVQLLTKYKVSPEPGAEAGLVPTPQELAAVAQLVFTLVLAPSAPTQ